MSEKNVKLIAVCAADMSIDYNDRFFEAFQRLAGNYNYKILFFSAFSPLYWQEKHDRGEGSIFRLLTPHLLDGIILLGETIKNDELRTFITKKANDAGIPVISIEHPLDGCINIMYEYETTMRKLITHLIEDHGLKRINFISGIKGNSFSEERLQVYKDVLTEHHIPIEEERIGYGGFWYGPTNEVLQDFLDSSLPFPEAIVCANDSMAIATIQFLNEHGYEVPEDVAVTGFDGIEEALDFIPPLTTIRYDIEGTVNRCFRIMERLLCGKEPEEPLEILLEIVYGTSCGCMGVSKNVVTKYNGMTSKLHARLNDHRHFNEIQIYMAADLTDNDSFFGVFDSIKQYADEFRSDKFWLCIVDDFLDEQEELSDIIDKSNFHRNGYSAKMNLMLSRIQGDWQGITDFNTSDLLPNLMQILQEEDALMFFPLHVLDQTIGYTAIAYDYQRMNMEHMYHFLMNISNALINTKNQLRQKNIIASLENKYVHDPMTGLYNRRGFAQRVEPLYQSCIENEEPIFIVSADLNGLKPINDTYGHADGDIAISTVGHALSHISPSHATCARFGGDEFVAAWKADTMDETEFRKQMHIFLDNFNKTSNNPYTISSSLGVVIAVPNENITLDDFIKFADEKMYEEKVKFHLEHDGGR